MVAWPWSGHRLTTDGPGGIFWSGGNVLKLDCGDDCTILQIHESLSMCTLEMGGFFDMPIIHNKYLKCFTFAKSIQELPCMPGLE